MAASRAPGEATAGAEEVTWMASSLVLFSKTDNLSSGNFTESFRFVFVSS